MSTQCSQTNSNELCFLKELLVKKDSCLPIIKFSQVLYKLLLTKSADKHYVIACHSLSFLCRPRIVLELYSVIVILYDVNILKTNQYDICFLHQLPFGSLLKHQRIQ